MVSLSVRRHEPALEPLLPAVGLANRSASSTDGAEEEHSEAHLLLEYTVY